MQARKNCRLSLQSQWLRPCCLYHRIGSCLMESIRECCQGVLSRLDCNLDRNCDGKNGADAIFLPTVTHCDQAQGQHEMAFVQAQLQSKLRSKRRLYIFCSCLYFLPQSAARYTSATAQFASSVAGVRFRLFCA